MIKTAFVLGAGLGTRLKSLTSRRPKPLIPVINRPLITYAFDHLLDFGVDRLIVNTHWRAEAYDDAFPAKEYRGILIQFREETPEVLETAGGIKNVSDLLGDEPFIVYNGDILSDLPLAPAVNQHRTARNEVTMILRSKDGPLQVAMDETTGRITDIGKRVDPASDSKYLFTGIYLVEPAFLNRIPPATKISVVPIFCEMIRNGAKLGGVVVDEGHWWDLGTRDQYLAVHRHLAKSIGGAPWKHESAQVASTAQLSGGTAIGAAAEVGEHATLHDCIVWDGAKIASGSLLHDCIVTDHAQVTGPHSHVDF